MKAEEGKLDEALQIFSQIIERYPNYGSAYNNRAQVLQFKGKVDEAITDCEKALKNSEQDVRTRRQAFTQRGILFKYKGEREKALQDFEKGAELGSELAKKEFVANNPYAMLCNQIVTEMFSKYKDLHDKNK